MRTFLLILISLPAFAAFTQKTAWEVRSTGDDLNGGGFDTSAAGTDRSQQDGPYITIDGATCTASVTSATPSVMTLSGCTPAPSSADAGNVVNVSGGSAIAGRYRIASVSGSDWTLDRNACASGPCTATGRMGGGLATITAAVANYPSASFGAADMITWVKAGNYGPYGTTTLAAVTGANANTIACYESTHGDVPSSLCQVGFNAGGGGNGFAVTTSTGGWHFRYLNIDGGGTATQLVNHSNVLVDIFGSKISNSSAICVVGTVAPRIYFTEITGCSGANAVQSSGGANLLGNWIHDNANSTGAVTTTGGQLVAIDNLLTNNGTGTGSGFRAANDNFIAFNTIYRQSGNAVTGTGTGYIGAVQGNIFACSGGYGIGFVGTPSQAIQPGVDYNGHHANATGNVQYVTAGSHETQVGAPGTTCATNNPFYAPSTSGTGDWALSASPTAGGLLRKKGIPGPAQGASSGPFDVGAFPHVQDLMMQLSVQ